MCRKSHVASQKVVLWIGLYSQLARKTLPWRWCRILPRSSHWSRSGPPSTHLARCTPFPPRYRCFCNSCSYSRNTARRLVDLARSSTWSAILVAMSTVTFLRNLGDFLQFLNFLENFQKYPENILGFFCTFYISILGEKKNILWTSLLIAPKSVELDCMCMGFKLTSFLWCNAHCTQTLRRIRNLCYVEPISKAYLPVSDPAQIIAKENVWTWCVNTVCRKSPVEGALHHTVESRAEERPAWSSKNTTANAKNGGGHFLASYGIHNYYYDPMRIVSKNAASLLKNKNVPG